MQGTALAPYHNYEFKEQKALKFELFDTCGNIHSITSMVLNYYQCLHVSVVFVLLPGIITTYTKSNKTNLIANQHTRS